MTLDEDGTGADLVGNALDITFSGGFLPTDNGIRFHGVDGKGVVGNVGNTKSMSFRIKLDSTTEKILEGAANDKLIHASSGTMTYPEFDNAFIDGIDSNAITAGQWTNVVIVSSTNVDMSAVTIALNNATYGDFEMADLRFYSTQLTLANAITLHNSFILPTLVETFDEGADGIAKLPREWIAGTGTYKIDQYAIVQGELVGSFANSGSEAYDTFTTSGLNISSAIYLSTIDAIGGGSFNSVQGKRYKISLDLVVNSGDAPYMSYGGTANSVSGSQNAQAAVDLSSSGHKEIIYVSNQTSATRWILFRSILASNFSITNFSFVEIDYANDGSGIYYEPIKHGDKYLECTVAGTIATLSGQAYGTWEWDMLKGADGNSSIISLISDAIGTDFSSSPDWNGYALILNSSEAVLINKYIASTSRTSLFSSANSYININQWYHVKVTRTKAGVFTVWVDDVLLDVSGGSGTNPVTDTTHSTSVLTVLDNDAGDRVANFNYKDEIEQ
jgi:hypothetical protein